MQLTSSGSSNILFTIKNSFIQQVKLTKTILEFENDFGAVVKLYFFIPRVTGSILSYGNFCMWVFLKGEE